MNYSFSLISDTGDNRLENKWRYVKWHCWQN